MGATPLAHALAHTLLEEAHVGEQQQQIVGDEAAALTTITHQQPLRTACAWEVPSALGASSPPPPAPDDHRSRARNTFKHGTYGSTARASRLDDAGGMVVGHAHSDTGQSWFLDFGSSAAVEQQGGQVPPSGPTAFVGVWAQHWSQAHDKPVPDLCRLAQSSGRAEARSLPPQLLTEARQDLEEGVQRTRDSADRQAAAAQRRAANLARRSAAAAAAAGLGAAARQSVDALLQRRHCGLRSAAAASAQPHRAASHARVSSTSAAQGATMADGTADTAAGRQPRAAANHRQQPWRQQSVNARDGMTEAATPHHAPAAAAMRVAGGGRRRQQPVQLSVGSLLGGRSRGGRCACLLALLAPAAAYAVAVFQDAVHAGVSLHKLLWEGFYNSSPCLCYPPLCLTSLAVACL